MYRKKTAFAAFPDYRIIRVVPIDDIDLPETFDISDHVSSWTPDPKELEEISEAIGSKIKSMIIEERE